MSLLPVMCATVAPALLILAAAYPLRPQGGRMPARPVPARLIIDRLADEARRGLIPAGPFGDTRRPVAFTVQPRPTLWRVA